MEPKLETHFLCMEHDIWYEKEVGVICPACERELCEEHDNQIKEKKNEPE